MLTIEVPESVEVPEPTPHLAYRIIVASPGGYRTSVLLRYSKCRELHQRWGGRRRAPSCARR